MIHKFERPLPSEGLSEPSESGFGQELTGLARGQHRTHRAFESTEETFHRPTLPITPCLEIFFRQATAPQPIHLPVGSMHRRFNHARHCPFLWTLRMDPFGVAARVRVQLVGHRRLGLWLPATHRASKCFASWPRRSPTRRGGR
jgi:hypothetical protein